MLIVYYNPSQEDDNSHGLTPQAWEQGDEGPRAVARGNLVGADTWSCPPHKSEVTLRRV